MKDTTATLFTDRTDAGQRLAEALIDYFNQDMLVLAVVRGGVPVATAVAGGIRADLDIIIPRKIPIPSEPEAGYGAVTEDGTVVLNERLVQQVGLSRDQINQQAEQVRREIERRSSVYRSVLPPVEVAGRRTIVIDDGLASGYTVIAAIRSLQKRQAAEIIVAVPTCSAGAYDLVRREVDDLVTLNTGYGGFFAVAAYYRYWHDLTDQEVIEQLEKWKAGYA